jgi:hypothetical protein
LITDRPRHFVVAQDLDDLGEPRVLDLAALAEARVRGGRPFARADEPEPVWPGGVPADDDEAERILVETWVESG